MPTDYFLNVSFQLQHGLLLTNDNKQRVPNPDMFMYQKENLLKMHLSGAGASQLPGVMLPPHFHNQLPGLQFRGFPPNLGPGRFPPLRFHPSFVDKPPFPPPPGVHHPNPPGFHHLGDHNISLR